MDGQRIHLLDLLRFLSALSVLFFHYALYLSCFADKSSHFMLFIYGRIGVSVFFMISGFVILMSAEGRTWRQFVVSRIRRLYPAYWFCCTVTFLYTFLPLKYQSADFARTVPEYLVNLTMLPRFVNVRFVDDVYWSLQVEIIFYFFVFVILLLSALKLIRKVLFAWAFISALNLFLGIRIAKILFITDHSHFFILGAVYYLAMKEKWDVGKVMLAAGMFALSVIYATKGVYTCPVAPAVVILACINLVFIAISLEKLRWRSAILPLLGEASYPLYLIHRTVGFILLGALPWSKPTKFMAVSAGMIAAAFVIARFIERPVRKWLKPRLEWFFDVVPAIWGVRPAFRR